VPADAATRAARERSAAEAGPDAVEPANRKLIRPQLSRHPTDDAPPQRGKRPLPPHETGLEDAHYQKQQNLRTRLAFTLEGGEVLHARLEWFDRDCLMLRRDDGSSLLLMKHAIVHWSRDEDGGEVTERRGSGRGPARHP
jgi:sRNA-binding regulator protein Hfq